MKKEQMGKLVAVHGTSPAYLQRAAIVALMTFVFFLAMLIAFSIRQQIGYFMLATAFLVVNIFTLIGWWMQRSSVVEVFENGIAYRKNSLHWEEITGLALSEKFGLKISGPGGQEVAISKSIADLDGLADTINGFKAGK